MTYSKSQYEEMARKFNILNTHWNPTEDQNVEWPLPDICVFSYLASKLNGEYNKYFDKEE